MCIHLCVYDYISVCICMHVYCVCVYVYLCIYNLRYHSLPSTLFDTSSLCWLFAAHTRTAGLCTPGNSPVFTLQLPIGVLRFQMLMIQFWLYLGSWDSNSDPHD